MHMHGIDILTLPVQVWWQYATVLEERGAIICSLIAVLGQYIETEFFFLYMTSENSISICEYYAWGGSLSQSVNMV